MDCAHTISLQIQSQGFESHRLTETGALYFALMEHSAVVIVP